MSDSTRRLRALLPTLAKLAESVHDAALAAHPLFSSEHWKHNAGYEWPDVDDGTYLLFENCIHPQCKAIREVAAVLDTEGDASPVRVTRLEVIGPNGRIFSKWDCGIQLSYQDGGRTLKVFVDWQPQDRLEQMLQETLETNQGAQ